MQKELEEELYNDKGFPKYHIASAVANVNDNNAGFVKKLCYDPNFPKSAIGSFAQQITEDNKEVAEILCSDYRNFSLEETPWIIYYTKAKNKDFSKVLCSDKKFSNVEMEEILSNCTEKPVTDFVEKIYNSEVFPKKHLPKLAKFANTKEKLEKAEALMSTPKLQNWVSKNLDNGLNFYDIELLLKTQKRLYTEAEQNLSKKSEQTKTEQPKVSTDTEAKTNEQVNAEKTLSELGIDPRMAPAFIKRCSVNGLINYDYFNTVCNLAKAKIPAQDIMKNLKDLFNLATGNPLSDANGEFRTEFIDDIINLYECGVSDLKLATNISSVINMPTAEMKSRINTKTRSDLAERIKDLPDEVKAKIEEQGYDLNAITEKALTEPKHGLKVKKGNIEKIKLRPLESIVGTERVVLNKFKSEISPEIWGNEERFKKWTEDRLAQIIDFDKNPDYTATGKFEFYNNARKQGVEQWYNFLTKESNHRDDIFAHLLVMDAITKEMKPNNAYTPPAVSHESFEATYNALLEENTKVSFSDLYSEQIRERAIKEYGEPVKTVDGYEGQWVSIPCSKRGDADYDDRIAMVQALSKGSSWCLRFDNAHTYLQKGSLNFFLDKTGNAQTAINVRPNGEILEIEKRYNQNKTVPIPLANVIEEWVKEKGYTGWEEQRNTALKAKPQFDERRKTFTELQNQNDSLTILKQLGIDVEVLSDGTYKISKYQPIQDNLYSLCELGIDEDKLMENVSIIDSNLNLNGSALTALPRLRQINGAFSLGDNRISDVRNLESINQHNIYWDKD